MWYSDNCSQDFNKFLSYNTFSGPNIGTHDMKNWSAMALACHGGFSAVLRSNNDVLTSDRVVPTNTRHREDKCSSFFAVCKGSGAKRTSKVREQLGSMQFRFDWVGLFWQSLAVPVTTGRGLCSNYLTCARPVSSELASDQRRRLLHGHWPGPQRQLKLSRFLN